MNHRNDTISKVNNKTDIVCNQKLKTSQSKLTTAMFIVAVIALALSISFNQSQLAFAGNYSAKVKVVHTQPIFETAYEDVEVCREKIVTVGGRKKQNVGGKIAGGIIGGVIGNQFGTKGKASNDVFTAGGAVVGSEVGDDGSLSSGEGIGAVAGGLFGNAISKDDKDSRAGVTAAGAIIGSIIGHEVEQDGKPQHATKKVVKECHLEARERRVISGYKVHYNYGGQQHVDQISYEPSDYIYVNVNTDIIEDANASRY